MKGFTRLVVRDETKTLLMGECKTEFLKHRPHLREINITQDMVLKEICQFYLRI